jgi:signal peptidase I
MVQEEHRPSATGGSNPATGAASQWETASPEAATASDNAPSSSTTSNTSGRAVREIVETLLLAALIFFLVRLVVLNFRVDGASMTPNLQNEQMLLVNVNSYRHFDMNDLLNLLPGDDRGGVWMVWPFGEPERGDIIVFNPSEGAEQPYIKRIIGLPGERITFQDGYVYVNGQQLDESYIDGAGTDCRRRDECDVIVREDHVFVLGDNRTNSTDSRSIGQVPLSNVIGKAWLSYWPLDLFGFVPHYEYANHVENGAGAMPAFSATPPAATETPAERRERRNERRAAAGTPTLAPRD